jgi:hypothetical protein
MVCENLNLILGRNNFLSNFTYPAVKLHINNALSP